MIIAVSGNVGSGKTTLAKWIAEKYGFFYIPQKRLEFNFLDEFFDDVEGKFFPAQVSFLLSKAIELQENYSKHKNIIIDRSFLEDIEVFARLWIENRSIDPKIVQLYRYTAEFIKSSVPQPTLYIICKCSADVSLSRIDLRKKRSFEEKYPPNHVHMLEKYYNELQFDAKTPYVVINTEYYNFTEEHDLNLVCSKIFSRIKATEKPVQISIFEESTSEYAIIEGMEFYHFSQQHPIYYRNQKSAEYIYLAAPFTQLTEGNEAPDKDFSLLSFLDEVNPSGDYGELPKGYQRALTSIQRALEKKYSMQVFLPHKDINNWGKTHYSSDYLAPRIVDTVRNAKALVAIPGNSLGVHLELGIAIANRIPVVIFDVEEFRCGYLIQGFAQSESVKYIRISSIRKIANEIKQTDILKSNSFLE